MNTRQLFSNFNFLQNGNYPKSYEINRRCNRYWWHPMENKVSLWKNHHSERNDNQIQIEITSFLMKNMSKKKLHLNLDTCKVGNEAHKILWNVWPNTTDDKSVNIEYWVFLESGKRANTNTMRTWNISVCLPLVFLLFYSLHFILLKIQNIDLKVRSIISSSLDQHFCHDFVPR